MHLCAATKQELLAWITAVRLAKVGLALSIPITPITRSHVLQYGEQLQNNYEDTKAEMPWLQLEDDNLDRTTTTVTRTEEPKPSPDPMPVTTVRT